VEDEDVGEEYEDVRNEDEEDVDEEDVDEEYEDEEDVGEEDEEKRSEDEECEEKRIEWLVGIQDATNFLMNLKKSPKRHYDERIDGECSSCLEVESLVWS